MQQAVSGSILGDHSPTPHYGLADVLSVEDMLRDLSE